MRNAIREREVCTAEHHNTWPKADNALADVTLTRICVLLSQHIAFGMQVASWASRSLNTDVGGMYLHVRGLEMKLSVSVLSTYPPTQCGIANFSASLVKQLRACEVRVDVVELVDSAAGPQQADVVHRWVRETIGGASLAARAVNRSQVALIEHEFGIFGGADGSEVLDILDFIRVPIITVMHTVLSEPTQQQSRIVRALLDRSALVVVMTRAARVRLIGAYGALPTQVTVIPHGAPMPLRTRRARAANPRPVILTWGLLGPGKGIEWAIEAMALLGDLALAPDYRIVGQTHPRVLERQGESYRLMLMERVSIRGVQDRVLFDGRYLQQSELAEVVASCDIVLLPYDSTEQVTSGVLVEAIAAGKPVISTRFPHAVELLSGGAGILIERKDPESISDAVRKVLCQPGLASAMADEAARLGPDLVWPAVARRYRDHARAAITSSARLPANA